MMHGGETELFALLGLPFLLVARGVVREAGRCARCSDTPGGSRSSAALLLVGMGVALMTGGWTVLMSSMLAFYA